MKHHFHIGMSVYLALCWLLGIDKELHMARAGGLEPEAAEATDAASPCWKTLADKFRFGSDRMQAYRPLITLEASKGQNIIEFDDTVMLGPVNVGDKTIHHAPYSHIVPLKGRAYIFYYDALGKSERCTIPKAAFKDPDFLKAWAYSGVRLRLQKGETLAYNVRSEIPYVAQPDGTVKPVWLPDAAPYGGHACNNTNLHTHGLLVKPTDGANGAYGDYVLQTASPHGGVSDPCAVPNSDSRAAHTHAASLPVKVMRHKFRIPGQPDDPEEVSFQTGHHPSGLFYFHPHPHGFSSLQLSGGTTSIITIGGMAHVGSVGSDAKQNVRHIMLKDMQIAQDATTKEWNFVAKGDTGLCDAPAPDRKFWLGGECSSKDQSQRWMFTINGVQNPTISDLNANEYEIWRITNASPTVSYQLAFIENSALAADPANRKRMPFHIISKDGAAAPREPHERGATQVFLMPGSRIEIAFVRPDTGAEYSFVTEGVETGGDSWRPVQLATVRWQKTALPTAPAPALANLRVYGAKPVRSANTPGKEFLSGPCDALDSSQERVIYFVKNPLYNDRQGNDLFGVIAGVRDANEKNKGDLTKVHFYKHAPGTPADALEKIAWSELHDRVYTTSPTNFQPAFGQEPFDYGSVCTSLNRDSNAREIWVLENWTNEIHNFHLHQSKFAVADKIGDDNYFHFPCATIDGKKGCTETDRMIAEFFPKNTGLHHDTVPIPRGLGEGCTGELGKAGCDPGRVTVAIPFNREEMIGGDGKGDFVYHCHILEHEDRGMMGLVRVLDPQKTPQKRVR